MKINSIRPLMLDFNPDAGRRQSNDDIEKSESLKVKSENIRLENPDGIDDEKIENISRQINKYLSPRDISLSIYIHDATGQVAARIINNETREVIKEIPASEILDLRARINEMAGIIFDRKI